MVIKVVKGALVPGTVTISLQIGTKAPHGFLVDRFQTSLCKVSCQDLGQEIERFKKPLKI